MSASPHLDDGSFYALNPACRFDSCEPAAVIETVDDVFNFEGVDAALFTGVLNRLDGTKCVAEIAADLGMSSAEVHKLCGTLARYSLASRLERSRGPRAPSDLAQLCADLFPGWKARVFGHTLWRSLADGSAKRTVFVGWLLETYHFIETVNSRLALAIAECRRPEARALFLHHYIEEWDHHHFFMSSLNSLGFDAEFVWRSRPLPGTLGVVNYMRDIARRDPLYYAACSGFLESTGEDRAGGREFFERLIRHYCPDNPSVITPMRAHLDLDEDYGHNGMLSQIYSKLGFISHERMAGAFEAVVGLVESLELWSTDILKTYAEQGPASNPVGRYRRGARSCSAAAANGGGRCPQP